MEEGINLKKKIQLCREENSNKKLIRYPEALKREILDFLKEEKVSKFCKEAKVSLSTINNWKKSYVSTVSPKKSLFKAVSLKKEKSCDEREGLSFKGSRLGSSLLPKICGRKVVDILQKGHIRQSKESVN